MHLGKERKITVAFYRRLANMYDHSSYQEGRGDGTGSQEFIYISAFTQENCDQDTRQKRQKKNIVRPKQKD